MSVVVEAVNLQKNYGNFKAVKGIDFNIRKGKCFGILGPNGAGKTTTVAMIYCFLPLSGGSLTVLGHDVTREQRAVKSKLGVVPQENNLDLELSVMENLLVYAGYFGINMNSAGKKAEELLDFFGLSGKARDQVEQISGGMKRRLTIARGLIHNPEILILDEPTTGLDPQSRQMIWQHLRKLKNRGLTVILTTHYLEEASQLCDHLIIVDEGVILEEGNPPELIKKHVGEKVIEAEVNPEQKENFINTIKDFTGGHQLADETFYLYIPGEETNAVEKIHALDSVREYRVRPSNLEDVFLKLTGRGLSYAKSD